MLRFHEQHIIYLSVITFVGLSWVIAFMFFEAFWPAAFYSVILIFKEYLLTYFLIFRNNRFAIKPANLIQGILHLFLLFSCAYYIGGIILVKIVCIVASISIVLNVVITSYKNLKANHPVEKYMRTLQILGFLSIILFAVIFSPEKILSQAWILSLIIGLFEFILPYVASGKIKFNNKLPAGENRARFILSYELIWLVLPIIIR